jgi:hypothetical protein
MDTTKIHPGDVIDKHKEVVEEFIKKAMNVPNERWNIPRAKGKWSPSQEVKHLTLTYRSYIIELHRGPDVTPETFPAQREVYRVKLLPRVLKGNWFPTGAQSPDSVKPDNSVYEKNQQFAELRKRVTEFESQIMKVAESNPTRQIRHPFFGALGLSECIIVLSEHTRHHMNNLPVNDGYTKLVS